MNRIILIFGVIAGAICSLLVVLLAITADTEKAEAAHSIWLGYAILILGLSTTYFGIKTYRDNYPEKASFKNCFLAGLGIVLLASLLYMVSWEFVYQKYLPDYIDKHTESAIKEVNAGTAANKSEQITELISIRDSYKNSILVRFGFTLLEIFPVGLLLSLVFAAVLRRKKHSMNEQTESVA